MTIPPGPAERLTIYFGESDRHHHQALFTEIVHRALAAGLAGASVWQGFEGYGLHHQVHTARILSLSEDLPIVVELIDTTDNIDAFLPQLDDLAFDGLIVREPVTVVAHRSRDSAGSSAGDPS